MPESDINRILQSLGRIEQKVDNALAVNLDHEKRIRVLEGRGSKRWDTAVAAIMTSVISALVGYIVGTFI